MLRHLIISFERALTLQRTRTIPSQLLNVECSSITVPQRPFLQVGSGDGFEATRAAEQHGNLSELDSDYIVPYRADREKRTKANVLLEALRTRFRLTEADLKHIMKDEVVNRFYHQRPLVETLETLCLEGITKRSFMDCPWLITLDKKRLLEKINLIRSMPCVRDINDFVPLLRLQLPRFRKLISSLQREAHTVPQGNRVYYISKKLQINAYTVNKYLVKRLFVLEMPFDMFEKNLQHMIDYKVEPLNILRDLWAFRYAPTAVEVRLKRAKLAKKEKIMPWMVRCPESILQRSFKLTRDELKVLGNRSSVAEYVADRLGFGVEEAKAILDKHPQTNSVRVTKIKEVLDYLLDEAGFTRFEIAQVPRVLCHSLKTTKKRIEELKSHGCRPTSLVIVCRSKREYGKFLNAWIQSSEYRRKEQEKEKKGRENTNTAT